MAYDKHDALASLFIADQHNDVFGVAIFKR